MVPKGKGCRKRGRDEQGVEVEKEKINEGEVIRNINSSRSDKKEK